MRSLLCFAAVGVVAFAPTGYAEDPKKQPEKAEVTKATYMVSGLHCAPCATTVEGSLKKVKGVRSVRVDFPGKYAVVEFEEVVISAQEVARAVSATPHMMGREMAYGGVLVLSVPGLKDEATGKKATAALGKVEGVAKVTPYPQQQAVGVEFTDKGKVSTKQLIETLEAAGLKGAQYGAATGPGGQSGPAPDHAGMAMGDGGMGGHAGMAMGNGGMPRMSCGCGSCGRMMPVGAVPPYYAYPAPRAYYGPGVQVRGGCCR
ncbi:MAG: heavy-metal-associated domain-containing protein [Gemmataceae bacterium]|nr:heavy-metal-associated domain-containing protein [Gemmataceae bacterium]